MGMSFVRPDMHCKELVAQLFFRGLQDFMPHTDTHGVALYGSLASRTGFRGVLTQQTQVQFVRAQDSNIKLRGAARK